MIRLFLSVFPGETVPIDLTRDEVSQDTLFSSLLIVDDIQSFVRTTTTIPIEFEMLSTVKNLTRTTLLLGIWYLLL